MAGRAFDGAFAGNRLPLSLFVAFARRLRVGAKGDGFRIDPFLFDCAGLEGLHRFGQFADLVASFECRRLGGFVPPL